MLGRILTEEVQEIDEASVRTLGKLVCYHDLVGDIVSKGRDRAQLSTIVESPGDLEMLVALAEADMAAVSTLWIEEHRPAIEALRNGMLEELKRRS